MRSDAQEAQEQGQEFIRLVAEVLKVKPSAITDQASPRTLPGWDSLRSILLVTAVEERYQVTLTLAEMMSISTVGDLRNLLQRHGVSISSVRTTST